MAVKKYTKKPIKYYDEPIYKDELVVEYVPEHYRKQASKTTVWDFFKDSYYEFIDMLVASKFIGFLIPLVLIIAGVLILHDEIWPEVEQQILESEGYYDQGTVPLVQGDYIQERQLRLSNPGSDYFKNLTESAFNEHVLKDDPISKSYSGQFSISLPTIDLTSLPVTANVDSGNEQEYQNILNTSLAHMKGTSLPISDIDNNIVIYGHSARGDYYETTQDPAGAFSRLQRLKIGDEVSVTIEGQEHTFKVHKTKVVEPTAVEIINGTPGRSTLTLFTCFPNGNPDKRLIVVARPVE